MKEKKFFPETDIWEMSIVSPSETPGEQKALARMDLDYFRFLFRHFSRSVSCSNFGLVGLAKAFLNRNEATAVN